MGGEKELMMARLSTIDVSKDFVLSIWTYEVAAEWAKEHSQQRLQEAKVGGRD